MLYERAMNATTLEEAKAAIEAGDAFSERPIIREEGEGPDELPTDGAETPPATPPAPATTPTPEPPSQPGEKPGDQPPSTPATPETPPPADGEEEFVSLADYRALQAELEAARAGQSSPPADGGETPPVVPASEATPEPPAQPQATPPALTIDGFPEVDDEYLSSMGFDVSDTDGIKGVKEKILKRDRAVAEAVVSHVQAQVYPHMNTMVDARVNALWQGLQLSSAFFGKYPELNHQDRMGDVQAAMKAAIKEANPTMSVDALVEKAKVHFDKANKIVQTVKVQGGKVIRPASIGPGTTPGNRGAGAPRGGDPAKNLTDTPGVRINPPVTTIPDDDPLAYLKRHGLVNS